MVTVVEVDVARKRVALSMKSEPLGAQISKPGKKAKPQVKEESMEAKLAQLKTKFK